MIPLFFCGKGGHDLRKLKLPKIKIPVDFSDVFVLAGTACFVYGLWGYDPRAALMALGMWLTYLGRPSKRGDG
jgi:hypothetical protein